MIIKENQIVLAVKELGGTSKKEFMKGLEPKVWTIRAPKTRTESFAVPDSILAGANHYLIKFDHYWGEKDHIAVTIWRQLTPEKFNCALPVQICSQNLSHPQDSWVNRLNWDRTISPTLLNHFAFGQLNRNEGYGSINAQYVGDLPQIAGAFSHNVPPQMSFSNGFSQMGNNNGVSSGNKTTRPTIIANDLFTWVRGSHTFKFGGE